MATRLAQASSVWRQRGQIARATLHAGLLLAIGMYLARGSTMSCLLVFTGVSALVALLIKPELGLYALAFAIPFGSLLHLPLGLPLGVSELVLGATIAALTLQAAVKRSATLHWHPLTLAWGLYAFILAFSLLVVSDLREAVFELAKWIELVIVMLLVSNLGDHKKAQNLVIALLAAAMAEALLGLYQFLFQVGPAGFVLLGRFMRAFGTFEQPNPFAGYLGMVLPLSYGILIVKLPHLRETGKTRDWRTLIVIGMALLACVTLMAGIVASWSRGALLGMIAGAALVILSLRPRAWVAICLVAVLFVAIVPVEGFLTADDLVGRVIEPLELLQNSDITTVEITDSNFSTVERAAHWLAAWRMFENHPWTGVGLGQYATAYAEVAVPRWTDPLGHAHNIYLNILAENGLPGLLAFIAVLIVSLSTAWRKARSTHGLSRAVALASLGMLGHLVAHSLVDNLFVHNIYLYMGMLLGLMIMPGLIQNTWSFVDAESDYTDS